MTQIEWINTKDDMELLIKLRELCMHEKIKEKKVYLSDHKKARVSTCELCGKYL